MNDNYSSVEQSWQALREIIQEIALLGLWRGKFFEHAAFYGDQVLLRTGNLPFNLAEIHALLFQEASLEVSVEIHHGFPLRRMNGPPSTSSMKGSCAERIAWNSSAEYIV